MIFSSTTRYALRILIQMSQDKDHLVSANTLHEKLGIKRQYLRRLLTDLTRYGFIHSSRGRNGGYELAKDPGQIYLDEIIEAIEGFKSFEGCLLGVTDCNQSPECVMHSVWADSRNAMIHTFRTTTLATFKKDLIQQL
jgi:Rrf2 family protein